MGVSLEQLRALTDPMDYKYRVQSTKYSKCTIVSYIDSRQVQERFDNVVGAGNWQTDFKTIGNNLFGGIGVNVTYGDGSSQWVWKYDVGTESNVDKEKGEVSDAVKRAAVNWGVGRFLYSLGIITLKAKAHTNGKEYPTTDEGSILWSADDITEYCKKVVASGELNRTANGVKPLAGAKAVTAPKPPVKPPVVASIPKPTLPPKPPLTAEEIIEAKITAKGLFEKQDFSKVLAILIKDYKLTKYTKLEDFIAGESIEVIREIYTKVTAKK